MNIANILLQITGNSDDARRDVQQTAAELAAFDSIDAEAELDVDTAIAKAKIASLKRDIATLSDITLDVDADTGLARAQIAALNAELAVQQQIVDAAGDAFSGAGGSASDFGFAIGGLTGKMGPLVIVVAAVAAAIAGSLVAALVALTASLGAAVAALGALTIALGATLLPAIALGIGAFQRFKEQADQAGTPANRLKVAAQQLGQTFTRVLGPAADRVFDGLAKGMSALEPMLGRLRPAFTQFGEQVGRAFATIGRELANPAWARFFEQTIGSSSQLVGPLVSSFISLARVLRNIATAAMPFLVGGFRAMADGLRDLAKGTSDAGSLRATIGGLVDHLRSWLDLIGQVGRLTLGIFKGAAPAGKEFVDNLADGARNLADWANSAEGQAQIKQFFTDVLPLAQQVVGLVGDLTVAFIRFTQTAAPTLAVIVGGIRGFVQQLTALLGVQSAVFGALVSGAKGAAQGVASAFSGVVAAAKSAWSGARTALSRAISFVVHLPGGLVNAAQRIWSSVRGAVVRAISFVISLPGDLVGRARSIWTSVRSALVRAISFVIDLPAVSGLVSAARSIWEAINDALPDIDVNIDIHKPNISLSPAREMHPTDMGRKIGRLLSEGIADKLQAISFPPIAGRQLISANLDRLQPAAAGPAVSRTYNTTVQPLAGGGSPDPNVLAAQLEAAIMARGGA